MSKTMTRKITLIIFSLILTQSYLANNSEPFNKYDPNKGIANNSKNNNNSDFSKEEMRMMIMEEFQMRDMQNEEAKNSGRMALDDDEVLYLGPQEFLKGTLDGEYLIFNKTTNMFKFKKISDYKKVVTYAEVNNIIEKESIKEQTQGKIKK